MSLVIWGLVVMGVCASPLKGWIANMILAVAGIALMLNVCIGIALASPSEWKCTLHGAGMKTVCKAK